MSWSPQQDAAIASVRAWLADPSAPQVFRLFGYAGTGKTTLAKDIAGLVRGTVLYATYTGKAALVLRSKGCYDASTIHSLIYKADQDETTGKVTFRLDAKSKLADAELLIVDEVSMVDEALATDLLGFGVPILVLGDPAQLPPVKGEGYFINAEPDVMLTEVHRQARDNPIIRMSMDIREGRKLQTGLHGTSLVATKAELGKDRIRELVLRSDQLLCGLNKTRMGFNTRIRDLKGLEGAEKPWHPAEGDRLICLRNNRKDALLNGSLWSLGRMIGGKAKVSMKVDSLDERRTIKVDVFENFFNGTEEQLDWKKRKGAHEFTYGWAITGHKAQGSQWDNVLVFDESASFREHSRRWLYTAVTRAAERVTVIV